jgi:uncharacterized protein
MSPKEYFSLLFKCFFKNYSLEKEVKSWDKSQGIKTILWANLYNGILASVIVCLVWCVCSILNIPFDIILALKKVLFSVLGGILFGVVGSVVLGIVVGVVLGVLFGVVLGIFFGVVGGVVGGVAEGVVGGVVFGVGFGVLLGVIFDVVLDVIFGVFGGVLFGVLVGVFGGVLFGILENISKGIEHVFVLGLLTTISSFIAYIFSTGRFWYFFIQPLYKKSNPLWWDENIGIPVPFLPNILRGYAKAKDFNKTIEFAKFLIEERPVQRRVAQRSLILIALDRMKDFKTLDDVQQLASSLSFMPSDDWFSNFYDDHERTIFGIIIIDYSDGNLTKNYNDEYQKYLSISNDLLKTNEELNYANRVAVYERTRAKLLDYRKASNLSNSPFAQNFGEVADAWQKVLTKTIDDLRAGGKLPIANPYTLGKALQADSDQFLGRKDIIQKIETETLRAGAATALLFIGNRRTGKSSTLNNLQRFVQSAVRTVFADLQDAEVTNSTADFCETLTERIAKSLRIPAPPPIRDLAAFTKWLKQRDADLIRDNRYLLICIDEYERLEGMIKQGKLADLPDSLRHWIQHLQHIVFLFAGSHEPSELKGDLDWTDYLINVRNVPISYLEYDAAMQLVTMPVPNFDLTWKTDDLADKLVLRLGRQPYLLQCTMWNLVENLNNQSRKEATQVDIEQALDKVLEGDARNHFSHFWDTEMTNAMRQLLSNLARNTPPTEGSVLNSLKRKEIVKLEDGAYVFCVPLLKEWILRNVD